MPVTFSLPLAWRRLSASPVCSFSSDKLSAWYVTSIRPCTPSALSLFPSIPCTRPLCSLAATYLPARSGVVIEWAVSCHSRPFPLVVLASCRVALTSYGSTRRPPLTAFPLDIEDASSSALISRPTHFARLVSSYFSQSPCRRRRSIRALRILHRRACRPQQSRRTE